MRERHVFIPKGASVHDRYLKSRRRWCAKGIARTREELSRLRRDRELRDERLSALRRAARLCGLCGGQGRVLGRVGRLGGAGGEWVTQPCPQCAREPVTAPEDGSETRGA